MNLNSPNNISKIFLLSIILSSRFWICFGNRFHDETKTIISSLDDALKYMEHKPENINDNLVFGVLIAKANLQWIANALEYRSGSETWIGTIEQLLRRCDNIINFSSFNVPMLKKDLWENAAGNLKYGILKHSDNEFVLPKFDSCQSIDIYMMNGSPEDSDLCINELIHSNCNVSEMCWLSELNGDYHSGYKTSHRLLYFQVADRMNCEKVYPKKFSIIKAIKNKLCQKMLLEATAFSENKYFSLTQDLFMEHIALCGALEGHEEFAIPKWRNQVRTWQSTEGCFGQQMRSKNCLVEISASIDSINSDKTAGFNTDGCHSHVTSVAIAALSFFLRVTLKASFESSFGTNHYPQIVAIYPQPVTNFH